MDKELLQKQVAVMIAQKALNIVQHDRSQAQIAARITEMQAKIAEIEAAEQA